MAEQGENLLNGNLPKEKCLTLRAKEAAPLPLFFSYHP